MNGKFVRFNVEFLLAVNRKLKVLSWFYPTKDICNALVPILRKDNLQYTLKKLGLDTDERQVK